MEKIINWLWPSITGPYLFCSVAYVLIRGLFQVDDVAGFDAAFGDADFVAPAVIITLKEAGTYITLNNDVSRLSLATAIDEPSNNGKPDGVCATFKGVAPNLGILVNARRSRFGGNVFDIYGVCF